MSRTIDKEPTRRGAVPSLGALGAASALLSISSAPAAAQSQTEKTFFLVHGAYGGGYVWKDVTDLGAWRANFSPPG